MRAIGSEGTGNGQFSGSVMGIAIDSKGNIWVTDSSANRVEEFSPEGVFIKAVGSGGSGSEQFWVPEGLAFDSKGDLYVADRGNNRVEEFDSEGKYLKSITKIGNTETNEGPSDVVLDSSGNIWISLLSESKIQEFSAAGTLLRSFGIKGSEPGQLSAPERFTIGPEGDIWVAEYFNNRVQVFSPTGEYLAGFGSYGSGSGQFYRPMGIAIYNGNAFVLDAGEWDLNTGNSRVEQWKVPVIEGEARPGQPGSTVEYGVPVSGGGAPYAMGSKEVEEGWSQKDLPAEATAVFPPDEPEGWPASDYKRATVYYRDSTDRTVNVAAPSGGIATSEYNEKNDITRSLSPDNRATALKEAKPAEVAKLLDTQSEYNSEGTELFGVEGPRHLVKLANGKEVQARDHTVYKYDEGAPETGGPYRLVTTTTQGALTESEGEQDVRTTLTGYSGQSGLGWKLRKPTSTTTNPEGLNLTRTTTYEEATGNVTETATPAATPGPHAFYLSSYGAYGTGTGQLREPADLKVDASGNVWVADSQNHRVQEFNSKGEFVRAIGSEGTGNGQFSGSVMGVAIDSKGNIWVTNSSANRIEEFSPEGVFIKAVGSYGSGNEQFWVPEGLAFDSKGDLYVADRGNNRVEELNPEGKYLKSITKIGNTETNEGPSDVVLDSSGNIWISLLSESKIQEFNTTGTLLRSVGTQGAEPGQLSAPERFTIGPEGDIWVAEYFNNRVQVFSPTGEYLHGFGSHGSGAGQFYRPRGIAIYNGSAYVLDAGEWDLNTGNSRIEQWGVQAAGKEKVHVTQTIYYTTAANGKYPGCGERPEWANMPCQTQPAEQPGTSGLPNLPVVTYTYNMYGEPTKTLSTVGTETRTTTATYDEAGRPETAEVTSTVDTALPKATYKYSKTTGALVEQNTSTESLKSEYNTLGQLTSYTDADGNLSSYEYEKEGDYRLKKASDGKGSQTYEYDPTTGAVKELADSAAGKFTASYDVEGNLTAETEPNAMSANYTINPAGQLTNVKYVKTAHCAKTCPETWYNDTAIPSSHGQWLTQQSELAGQETSQTYTYDEAGRLTQATDNVGGKNCITRLYVYDEETNRLSQTTRPPATGGTCATTGGEIQTHTYDSANRLTDTGTKYDSFGNTTELPAADAGGSTLTSSYYQNNKLASQTQGTQTIGYQLDPAGRTREINSTGKIVATETQHYTSPSASTPAWTGELSGNYTRYITGISGGLAAIQHNTETPVLQLSNLHGDIIATATDTETATLLASTVAEASEYGVPATETPPKYSWLGADEMPTTLPSGTIAMGARSYIPQLGRFLQTDPIPGGSANAYAYTYGDPINSNDLTGEWTFNTPTWLQEANAGWGAREEQAQLAREQAAREEAERVAAREAALRAAAQETPSPTEGGPELPLGGSPEWECKYAAATGQEAVGCGGDLNIANNEDPDDKTPQKESKCNRTGQGCSGSRGGHGGHGSGPVSCGDVGTAAGGAVGAVAGGGFFSEPVGVVGGIVGGYLGSKIC